MIEKLKSKKGITLVELIIALAIIVILFAIFALVVTNAYRANVMLDSNKLGREAQVKNLELKVGSDNISVIQTGKVKVDLKFSEAGLSESDYGEAAVKDKEDISCNVYRSADYGVDEDGNAGNKYMYAFR